MKCYPHAQLFSDTNNAGLTKREAFAMVAMQGFMSYCARAEVTAEMAVKQADALIEELNKREEA